MLISGTNAGLLKHSQSIPEPIVAIQHELITARLHRPADAALINNTGWRCDGITTDIDVRRSNDYSAIVGLDLIPIDDNVVLPGDLNTSIYVIDVAIKYLRVYGIIMKDDAGFIGFVVRQVTFKSGSDHIR